MKYVNLIKAVPTEKQFEIRRWFRITIFMITLTFLVISIYSYFQLSIFYSLKKQASILDKKTELHSKTIEVKNKLTSELDILEHKSNKIDSLSKRPKNPHNYLAALINACGNAISLTKVEKNKKNIEISALCKSSEHAMVFLQRLSTFEEFSHLKLTFLGQQEEIFKITIKGIIK